MVQVERQRNEHPRGHVRQFQFCLAAIANLLDGGSFVPEQRLPPERALASQIGIGRRALRRALEVLEAEGRIWRHQGKGTFVGQRPPPAQPDWDGMPSRTNPLEVMEARLELEPVLARLASLRASNADLERLLRLAEKTASSSDADGRELWDGALHRAIAEAAGNKLLLMIFDVVDRIRQDATWQRLRERARSEGSQSIYVEHHRRVIAAIAQREAPAAERAMREHLETVRDGLLKVMGSPPIEINQGEPAQAMHATRDAELRHGT